MQEIEEIKLEVHSSCQLDCKYCGHTGMREEDLSFDLSISSLKEFIEVTEKSDYIVKSLAIHGPGEPLLWKNLQQGLSLLSESVAFPFLYIRTNGIALSNIDKSIFDYAEKIEISNYPGVDSNLDYVTDYPETIEIIEKLQFHEIPTQYYPDSIPCNCWCRGPTFWEDKIYVCGPPGFGAKERANGNFNEGVHYIPLQKDYMNVFPEENIGNMEICKYCWANNNIQDSLDKIKWKKNE